MAGTKKGYEKYRQTMINKLGSEEAFTKFRHGLATSGGKAVHSKPRGFAAMSVEKRIASAKRSWSSRKTP